MTTVRLAFILVLLPLVALAGCSKAPPKAPDSDSPAVVQAAPAARPWYADRFEKLGFYVFPHPVDVGDFEVEALSGGKVKLSQQKGKIVLLNFWATWCPPCRQEMPSINRLWAGMKNSSFTIMAVSGGEARATVEKFIADNNYTYPIYLDPEGKIGTAFNASSIPTTYIIDKQGRAIAGIQGAKEYDTMEVVGLLKELASK